MQVHQSIIHNFVIQASFQTNWQQDEMRPVALISEGNNGFPEFLHLFLKELEAERFPQHHLWQLVADL